MRARLSQAARVAGRTTNAEVVSRLEFSFEPELMLQPTIRELVRKQALDVGRSVAEEMQSRIAMSFTTPSILDHNARVNDENDALVRELADLRAQHYAEVLELRHELRLAQEAAKKSISYTEHIEKTNILSEMARVRELQLRDQSMMLNVMCSIIPSLMEWLPPDRREEPGVRVIGKLAEQLNRAGDNPARALIEVMSGRPAPMASVRVRQAMELLERASQELVHVQPSALQGDADGSPALQSKPAVARPLKRRAGVKRSK